MTGINFDWELEDGSGSGYDDYSVSVESDSGSDESDIGSDEDVSSESADVSSEEEENSFKLFFHRFW